MRIRSAAGAEADPERKGPDARAPGTKPADPHAPDLTAGELHVEVVRDARRFATLAPELWELFARDSRATPFQSPAWLLSWVETFAADAELCIILLRSSHSLLGCLPLYFQSRSGQRTLRWIGEGPSDYLDALIADGAELAVCRGARAALERAALEVDRLVLADLPEHSPLLPALDGAGWGAARVARQPCAKCPRLPIDRSFAAYVRSLPGWLARNVLRSEARLSARGTLTWSSATSATLGGHLEVLIALHSARWAARNEAGVLGWDAVQAFHRRAAPRLLAHGLLDLSVLFLGAKPIAAAYTLQRRDAHFYLNGFDPSLRGVSLGSLTVFHALQQAFESSRQAADFLRGQEAYKYAWGPADTSTAQLSWSSVRSSAIRGVACVTIEADLLSRSRPTGG